MGIGWILLAIWLILTGLIALFGLTFNGLPLIMGILALAAGILLLIGDNWRRGGGRRGWKWDIGPGIILLAIWLILTGLISLFGLSFPGLPIVMGLLALIAGIVLFIRR